MSTDIIKQTGTPKESTKACPQCHANFSTQWSLTRHLLRVHRCTINKCVTLYCPYEQCNSSFLRYNSLDTHLSQIHYEDIRKESLTFSNLNDFEAWLRQVTSSSSGIKYIKRSCNSSSGTSSSGTSSSVIYKYYRCHRSGLPKTKMTSIKTVKIGRHCPSRIIAKITDRNVQVEFVPTHIGHECEIAKIPLNQKKRIDIACRLSTATNNSVAVPVAALPNEAQQQQQTLNPELAQNHQLNHEQHLQPQPPPSQQAGSNNSVNANPQATTSTIIQNDNSLIVTLAPIETTTVQQDPQPPQLGHPIQRTHLLQNQIGQQQQQQQVQNNTSLGLMNITSPNRQELTARFEQLMLSIRSDKHASIVKAQLEVCFALIRD